MENKGLIKKYHITKNDGSDIDPNAEYFILRIDPYQKDKNHYNACISGLISYMQYTENKNLAKDLESIINTNGRIVSILNCKTIEEFVRLIFKNNYEEYLDANDRMKNTPKIWKWKMAEEWLVYYFTQSGQQPQWNCTSSKEFAEAIYPSEWDDDTQLFQKLRNAICYWIQNYTIIVKPISNDDLPF